MHHGHGRYGGVSCVGLQTGLDLRLRVEDSESEAGQMGEAPVERGQQAGPAGLPGPGREPDPGGVCDRRRAAAALPRVQGLQEQGGLLSETKRGCAQPGLHEGTAGVRGTMFRCAGPVFYCSSGGESIKFGGGGGIILM